MSAADPFARRVRSWPAWRVAALAAGTVGVTLLAIVLLVAVAGATAPYSPLPARLHQAVVGLPTVLGLYAGSRRWLLRTPATSVGMGRPDRRLVGWIGVGAGLPILVLGIQLLAFEATLVGDPPMLGPAVTYALTSVAGGLLAGIVEEFPLRGVLLRVLEVRWGARTAIAATAAVFALLHQGHGNGRLELGMVLSSMFAAGLLLGVVVVQTRSVWPAVAVHAGWNTVFGGQLVTAVGPRGVPPAAVFQFRHQASSALLTGGEATLGAAPGTTAMLLVATLLVNRFVGRDRAVRG